jgi:hypothetical protein
VNKYVPSATAAGNSTTICESVALKTVNGVVSHKTVGAADPKF